MSFMKAMRTILIPSLETRSMRKPYRPIHGRILPPTTHDKLRVVPPIRQITPKNKKIKKLKFIDKAKQGVYIGVFKGAEFKNGLYFVIRPLLHCVLA